MYKVSTEYAFENALNFTFLKKTVFDFDNKECCFCLVVQNCDTGYEQLLLENIHNYEEFEDKAEKAIKEYALNYIVSNIKCMTNDLGLKDLKIEVIDDCVKINDKIFKLYNDKLGYDDYETLKTNLENHIKALNTK